MTRESEPISVAGMERMGMLMPIATPSSLIACWEVKPAAISLAGSRREMTELMREFEVRIPVIGSAECKSGLNCERGFFSLPPLTKK